MKLHEYMVELEPRNLHWLVEEDPSQDLCAHGGVYLKINNTVVSNGDDLEWTLSTSSFRLLKTVWENHVPINELDNQLIPCCGHSMWKAGDAEDGLAIIGCPNGINWEIKHSDGKVTHLLGRGVSEEVTAAEWRNAVCGFSTKVLDFFMTSWPKKTDDRSEQEGFELFMQLWRSRLDKSCSI